jgi:pimeloyl-ACP methyl ester carboxylesterase
MSCDPDGGGPLPYDWHGAGEPLVLVAGLGGKGTSWRPFLADAARSYRVLTFDLPGSGRAPALAENATIRTLAADALRLFDHLGLERFRLVGRSMGGMVAQEIALSAPERVERLVLVSTCARSDPHLAEVFLLWARMAELGVPAEVRHRSSMLWCLGAGALSDAARRRAYLVAKREGDRPSDYAVQARACASHDALDRLGRLRVPTLVLAGGDDRLTPPALAEQLARAIPGAEIDVVPDAGHLPYLETPEAFRKTVLEFLARPRR